MPGSRKTRGRSSGRSSTINRDAAGIDVGSTFHVVAVPGDRNDKLVRTFRTLSGDLYRLADCSRRPASRQSRWSRQACTGFLSSRSSSTPVPRAMKSATGSEWSKTSHRCARDLGFTLVTDPAANG